MSRWRGTSPNVYQERSSSTSRFHPNVERNWGAGWQRSGIRSLIRLLPGFEYELPLSRFLPLLWLLEIPTRGSTFQLQSVRVSRSATTDYARILRSVLVAERGTIGAVKVHSKLNLFFFAGISQFQQYCHQFIDDLICIHRSIPPPEISIAINRFQGPGLRERTPPYSAGSGLNPQILRIVTGFCSSAWGYRYELVQEYNY